jgi:hypothetical protein
MDLEKGKPREIILERLKPDTRYYYQLHDAKADKSLPGGEEVRTFHAQRQPGSTFVFTVQADSHLDGNASPELYRRMLANTLADLPDFHIDLGDTFMTDKHPSRDSAAKQYLAQRYYLGLIGQSAPVFLVLGNHDGEDGKLLRGGCGRLGGLVKYNAEAILPKPCPRWLLYRQRDERPASRPAPGLLRLAVGRRALCGARPVPAFIRPARRRQLGAHAGL